MRQKMLVSSVKRWNFGILRKMACHLYIIQKGGDLRRFLAEVRALYDMTQIGPK